MEIYKLKETKLKTIGSYCSFGKNISILTSNHDTNYISSQGFLYDYFFNSNHPGETNIPKSKERTKGPVMIGSDVWIGDDVKILSGVTIGDGACIAAGTIVTKDVSPYEIHAGVPNKKIKLRFPKEICDFLIDLKWWYWPSHKIKKKPKNILFKPKPDNSRRDKKKHNIVA